MGAKRLDCARWSGVLVRTKIYDKRMLTLRSNSGAEATKVQTLRDFASVIRF